MATEEDALFASFNNLSARPAVEAETAPAVEKEDYATWDNARVIKHLQTLGMPETVLAKIKAFEVTGEDLASLTVQELKADLEITKLQATRIKRSLDSDDPAGEEAQEKKDIEDARAQSVTGTLAAPADLSAAEEPLTAATLQSHSSMTRNRSPGVAALGTVVGLPVALSAPTGPVTAASLQVDQNLVNEWATKTALITKLEQDQVGEKLPSASQRLVYLKQNFADETAKFKELQKVNEKLTVKYTELEGGAWYPGKYLLGKHRREKKLDNAKDKASDTSRKLEAAGKLVENLAVKIEHQEQLVTELNAQVRALVQAKKWEENALLTAFSGIAGDAKENALEREVAALVPQLEQTRRYKTSYSQAFEHIHSARKMLEKAAQLFRSAYGLSGIDVAQNFFKPRQFRNTPAGLMVDVAKHAQSRQGVALCDQAAVSIQRASQIIPDMPRVDLQKVKGLRGLGIMDVVFDNMISDLIARRRIRECMELVNGQLSDTRYAEKWLEGWISGRIDQDLRALESSYALKKNELDNYRRGLLQMLMDSSSRRPAS